MPPINATYKQVEKHEYFLQAIESIFAIVISSLILTGIIYA